MEIRVITLRYSEGIQGFPEDALRKVCVGREVLDVGEHFFMYGNVPHLTLTVKLGGEVVGGNVDWREKKGSSPDLELELPEEMRGVFRELKKWRNAKMKEEGKPSYYIGRNVDLLEIVKQMPKTLAGLKEIPGMGESTVEKYGKEILEILANVPPTRNEEKSVEHSGDKDQQEELKLV